MLLLIHQTLPSLKKLDATSRAMQYNDLIGESRMVRHQDPSPLAVTHIEQVKVNSYMDAHHAHYIDIDS